MTKKLLTAVIGSALSLGAVAGASAETTLYGSARGVLNSCDTCVGTSTVLGDDDWVMKDAGSRIGVTGSHDVGGGLNAIYNYEIAVNVDSGVESNFGGGRPHYLGLSGGFGTATMGRQYNPYYDFIRGKLDIFNENWDFGVGNSTYTSRTSDMIKYVSPNLGGFTLELGAVVAGGSDGEDLDEVHLGASFSAGPVWIGVASANEKLVTSKDIADGQVTLVSTEAGGEDFDVAGAVVGVKLGPAELKAGYQNAELGSTSAKSLDVVAEVKLGSNGTLMAGYETMETDGFATERELTFSHIEYQYKLSKPVRVWAAVMDRDVDLSGIDSDPTIQLGMRVDF